MKQQEYLSMGIIYNVYFKESVLFRCQKSLDLRGRGKIRVINCEYFISDEVLVLIKNFFIIFFFFSRKEGEK